MSPALAKEDLLTPIPGDNPSGVSLRYEPVYDQLREARRSEEGGDDREPKVPDHSYVLDAAGAALRERTKDLQLGVWLVDALVGERGFAGLAEGLEFISGLLQQYWDTLYPVIEDGDAYDRIMLLDWLGNYYSVLNSSPLRSVHLVALTADGFNWDEYQQIAENKADAEPFEKAFEATPKSFYKAMVAGIDASLANLKALQELCDEKFGREAPGFSKLKQLLEQVRNSVQSLLKRKLEREPDPVVVTAQAGTAAVTAGEPDSSATATGTAVFTEFTGDVSGLTPASGPEAIARIGAAAHYMRRQTPSSPVPYLLLRSLRWGELRSAGDELPPRLLTAPPTGARLKLRDLAAEERWSEVLDFAEEAMATECGRAWLDLQRYTVTACEHLGYDAVARAIKSEIKCLLRDYPSLRKATLLDDTGAANPATVAWLNDFAGED